MAESFTVDGTVSAQRDVEAFLISDVPNLFAFDFGERLFASGTHNTTIIQTMQERLTYSKIF